MESYGGYRSKDNDHRAANFAAELLAATAGEKSLYDFYGRLKPGVSWQETFKDTFGMSIDDFYDRFEEWKQEGFPNPGISRR